MRFAHVFAASLVAPLVAAHGGDIPGAPKLFGMPKNLRARDPLAGHRNVAAPQLQARQGGDANNMCGPQGGGQSCAEGYCCSPAGYCGQTKEHCAAPDCQINFGPGCDANKTPYGASTRDDARPQLGSIEYGGWGIRECLKPKTVAITYDDGPYIYTEQVMAQFEARGGHATFFITGNNLGKGPIDESWRGVIEHMDARGHQIASHTWSHQNLDEITSEQRYDQMVKNEMALRNILGKYPTYMRPPYSACITQPCMDDMKDLGYVITSFDLDTDDYNNLTPERIQIPKDIFKASIDAAVPNGDRLAIAHDIHELTALNLTGYMLETLYDAGFTAVTVGECMNDPVENWYRDSAAGPRPSATSSSSAPVPTPTGPTSTDGQCGAANGGQSCIGFMGPDGISECCSPAGWCGRSVDHCGTGCTPLFGKCGTQPPVSAVPSLSVSKTSAAPVPTVSLSGSTDGSCGAAAGTTCIGFTLDGVKAECCSQYNYCGNTELYCGADTCNPLYGNCGSSGSSSIISASASATETQTSAAPQPTASLPGSVDGSCGAAAGTTCIGFTLDGVKAECCSQYNYCGNTELYCGADTCNPLYGNCGSSAVSSSVVAPASASSIAVSSDMPASETASSTYSVSASATPLADASASPSVSEPVVSVSKATTSSVYSVGQPSSIYSVGQPSSTPLASISFSLVHTSSGVPAVSTSTVQSSLPIISSIVQPSSKPSVTSVQAHPTTFGTVVKPSSTPAPKPTPAGPPVSKNGKCGSKNGGQTCAGYKNPFGWKIECCCKQSGRCSSDPWSCGLGCDAKYGKCNRY